MNIVIVTGVSGAGKSRAANILEDIGYYCIDNMPAALLSPFAELCRGCNGKIVNAAFVIDARGEEDFSVLKGEIEQLERMGNKCMVIYLECDDGVVINRYKESRRSHPLSVKYNITIKEALGKEREMLLPMREASYAFIDTSKLSLVQLRRKIQTAVCGFENGVSGSIFITCTSFGFKNGIPPESDNLFDVRCFPNPFYVDELKNLTGLDEEVKNFVFSFDTTREFLKKMFDMTDFMIPLYMDEGRTQVNISVGCTGGKHRSVAITEALGQHLSDSGYRTVIIHRDV